MARIYISSTYKDLKLERKAVRDALTEMGHKIVSMEDYPAKDIPPLQQCLDDVKKCDILVAIIAWHCGEKPDDLTNHPEKLSFTKP